MKTSLKLVTALALGLAAVPAVSISAHAASLVQEAEAGERGERRGYRHRGWSPEAAAERLGRIDADNDGVITRAEFLAHHSAQFDRMDVNNDVVVNAADRQRLRELWNEFAAERGVEPRPQRGNWRGRGGERADREINRADFEARGNAMFDRWAGEGNDSVSIEAVQARMAEMREQRQSRGERRQYRRRD